MGFNGGIASLHNFSTGRFEEQHFLDI